MFNALKNWALKKAVEWFPKERVAAYALRKLLEHADTRERVEDALKIANRVVAAGVAAVNALKTLLASGLKKTDLNDFIASPEMIALNAWSKGDATPAGAKHLKAKDD